MVAVAVIVPIPVAITVVLAVNVKVDDYDLIGPWRVAIDADEGPKRPITDSPPENKFRHIATSWKDPARSRRSVKR
jgi:hypothetical protein